jgi:hypothetical protein
MARSRSPLAVLATLLVMTACADDPGAAEPDGGLVDASPDAPDLTAALFARDHVVEVAIELPAADWDAIRTQTRPGDTLVGADCQDAPFGSPFTARMATVTVDGQRLEQVAVRKKGFLGSLDDDKPSLKLKFDEVIADQEVAGVRGLTLNNNRQDPSFLRQCLAYDLFSAAGLPAPRCNLAHVTVNGRDLGVFTNVESVNKRFLARHFTSADGRLYEGTLSDFRTGWLATFEPKTDEANPDRSDLEALAAAVAVPDAQLLAALAPVVDVEEFLTFWAMETLLGHGDGYAGNTNNFFVYREPGSARLHFLPWGVDGVAQPAPATPPDSVVMANGVLARRLYLLPETRTRYLARMQQLLDQVWDAPARVAAIDQLAALLLPRIGNDPFAAGQDVPAAIDELRRFFRERPRQVAPTIANAPPWTRALRSSFCFIELGPMAATFSTTFKTADPPDVFAAGTGTLTGTLGGVPVTASRIGSNAKLGDGGAVEVQLFALVAPTEVLVAVVQVPPAAFAPGPPRPIPIFSSFLFRFDPTTGVGEIVGTLVGGTLELTQAAVRDGAPVVGRWSGTVYSSPF